MTVSLSPPTRRAVEEGSTPPGRGVLSMQDLSHGVIRVDSEEKLSVLTLQDVGSVMPGGETLPSDPCGKTSIKENKLLQPKNFHTRFCFIIIYTFTYFVFPSVLSTVSF